MFKIKINDVDYTCFKFMPRDDITVQSIDIVVIGELTKENDLVVEWATATYKGIKTLTQYDEKSNATRFQLYLGER